MRVYPAAPPATVGDPSEAKSLDRRLSTPPNLGGGAAPASALWTLPEWSTRVKRLRCSLTVRDVFGLMLCSVPGKLSDLSLRSIPDLSQICSGLGFYIYVYIRYFHHEVSSPICSGAGETLVEAILEGFPTWHHLWSEYKRAMSHARERGQDPGRVADDLLSCIPVGVASGGGAGQAASASAADGGRERSGAACWGALMAGRTAGMRVVGPEVSRKIYRTLFAAAPSGTI